MGSLLHTVIKIVFIRTGHFTCALNGATLLCISSCRLGKSWCGHPQVNVIRFNRRLTIVSARSDVKGASNLTWSDMFIESTFMRYGHSQGGLRGITLNERL